MNAVLFGPPGSGKGTHAKSVATALGVPHVATGDIFRFHLKNGTALGTLARGYMDKGQLVPDSVTCDLVATRLEEPDAQGGVLFDGFPRSVAQAEWLLGWLSARGRAVGVVVNLMVPDSEIVQRIAGRRTCLGCGATYHVTAQPPVQAGRCDRCAGEVVQRADDREDVVLERLRTYARETAPVLALLRGATPVVDVDGVGGIEAVQARVHASLPRG
jgi:adenylate kinase